MSKVIKPLKRAALGALLAVAQYAADLLRAMSTKADDLWIDLAMAHDEAGEACESGAAEEDREVEPVVFSEEDLPNVCAYVKEDGDVGVMIHRSSDKRWVSGVDAHTTFAHVDWENAGRWQGRAS